MDMHVLTRGVYCHAAGRLEEAFELAFGTKTVQLANQLIRFVLEMLCTIQHVLGIIVSILDKLGGFEWFTTFPQFAGWL